jgi:hypothetical protein
MTQNAQRQPGRAGAGKTNQNSADHTGTAQEKQTLLATRHGGPASQAYLQYIGITQPHKLIDELRTEGLLRFELRDGAAS